MSKLTETMKAAFKAPLPDPVKLENRIAGQLALVRDIQQRHETAAFDWANGNASEDAVVALDAELVAAQRELRALQAAHKRAVEERAAIERARVAALHETQINAVQGHLKVRDKAAAELATALEQVAAAYKQLVKSSEKAKAANPLNGQWPGGALCTLDELKAVIAHEMFRLMGDPALDGRLTFPGAMVPDYRFLQRPADITPLVEVIERASKHTLDVLKGRKAPDAPAPVVAPAPAPVAPTAGAAADDPSGDLERQVLASGPRIDARGYTPARRTLS
ncbi:MAG TPA: hypothetical protein VGU20_01130 [Stellaceae bacterium]|nr:hypothetical protein [Stellaceae bacterium]